MYADPNRRSRCLAQTHIISTPPDPAPPLQLHHQIHRPFAVPLHLLKSHSKPRSHHHDRQSVYGLPRRIGVNRRERSLCPVLIASRNVRLSSPRNSPKMIRSGRIRSDASRSRVGVRSPWLCRSAFSATTFACVGKSSYASSMVTSPCCKRDSQGALNVIQAGICDGAQLGTRPDVGRGMGLSRALHSGDPSPERAEAHEPSWCSGWNFVGRANGVAVA